MFVCTVSRLAGGEAAGEGGAGDAAARGCIDTSPLCTASKEYQQVPRARVPAGCRAVAAPHGQGRRGRGAGLGAWKKEQADEAPRPASLSGIVTAS